VLQAEPLRSLAGAEQPSCPEEPGCSVPITLVVLTQDEEFDIGDCLESASGFNDIHVLDSGSTDRTVAIARARGATVHHHSFHGFGQQRNWAIDHVPARYDWQLHLDADERLTPELIAEMRRVIATEPAVGGFLVPSKLMFAGRWLKHAGQYPAYQVRLFHRQRLRFVDHGHGQRERTDLPVGSLEQPLLHFAFSKGLDHWFAKHATYARREAEQALGVGANFEEKAPLTDGSGERSDFAEGRTALPSRRDSFFSGDSTSRRRALKRLTARLPGRYFLRLLYMLLVKRAFLDGWAGIAFAHMMATYEAMIDVHLRLLRHGLKP
jgi:glycosyltransferase involved in cell wall biosynthesis